MGRGRKVCGERLLPSNAGKGPIDRQRSLLIGPRLLESVASPKPNEIRTGPDFPLPMLSTAIEVQPIFFRSIDKPASSWGISRLILLMPGMLGPW